MEKSMAFLRSTFSCLLECEVVLSHGEIELFLKFVKSVVWIFVVCSLSKGFT